METLLALEDFYRDGRFAPAPRLRTRAQPGEPIPPERFVDTRLGPG
jgi:hypothetical protein